MAKDKIIRLRVTEVEHARLALRAVRGGTTLSGLAREALEPAAVRHGVDVRRAHLDALAYGRTDHGQQGGVMALAPTHRNTRPYRGRSAEFADAMAHAEAAAVQKQTSQPHAHPFVGRTRSGMLVHRDGRRTQPGPLFPADDFNALPVV
jgi:hypothetical protein